jgi:hypothetical protein
VPTPPQPDGPSVNRAKMSEPLEPLRSRYFIPREINSEVEDQEGKMDELAQRYSDGDIGRLDGIAIEYQDGTSGPRTRGLLRQALVHRGLLRLNLESLVARAHMEEKRDEVLALIRA